MKVGTAVPDVQKWGRDLAQWHAAWAVAPAGLTIEEGREPTAVSRPLTGTYVLFLLVPIRAPMFPVFSLSQSDTEVYHGFRPLSNYFAVSTTIRIPSRHGTVTWPREPAPKRHPDRTQTPLRSAISVPCQSQLCANTVPVMRQHRASCAPTPCQLRANTVPVARQHRASCAPAPRQLRTSAVANRRTVADRLHSDLTRHRVRSSPRQARPPRLPGPPAATADAFHAACASRAVCAACALRATDAARA